MATLWMVLLVVAADPDKSAQAGQDPPAAAQTPQLPPAGPREGRILSEAAHAALRRWANPAGREAEQAAREFLVLFEELGNDQSLGVATRQQLRLRVRTRLAQLAEQIARRTSEDKGAGKGDRHLLCEVPFGPFRQKVPVPFSGETPAVPPERLGFPADGQDRLAQLGEPRPGGGAGRGRVGGGAARQRGAARGLGTRGAQPQNAGPPDAGQDLVELIQRTIAPSTWDVNGGPGTIRYWRPGMALVIRQTSEVHDDVADFLKQLDRTTR